MTPKWKHRNAVPVSDLASDILDPLLRKRAGISIALLQSWHEIVGDRLAGSTRPERIAWPRRLSEDDPFEPATLIVACEGGAALRLQHETTEVIGRVNAFLGFQAVGRVKIVQKPVRVDAARKRKPPAPLSPQGRMRLSAMTSAIEDPELRASLERLGANVLGRKP